MSDWSSGYEYNPSQYTNPNTWNNDSSSEYTSQGANYYNPNREYVNFEDFISQLQRGVDSQPNSTHYSGVPFQNYSVNAQYNFGNEATSTRNTNQNMFDHMAGPSTEEYEAMLHFKTNDDQFNEVNNTHRMFNASSNYLNSKLTPNATEFVPKMSHPAQTSYDTLAPSTSGYAEVHGSNDNFRGYTGQPSQSSHFEANDRQNWKTRSSQPSHSEVNDRHHWKAQNRQSAHYETGDRKNWQPQNSQTNQGEVNDRQYWKDQNRQSAHYETGDRKNWQPQNSQTNHGEVNDRQNWKDQNRQSAHYETGDRKNWQPQNSQTNHGEVNDRQNWKDQNRQSAHYETGDRKNWQPQNSQTNQGEVNVRQNWKDQNRQSAHYETSDRKYWQPQNSQTNQGEFNDRQNWKDQNRPLAHYETGDRQNWQPQNNQSNQGEVNDRHNWKSNSRVNGKDGIVFYNSSLNKESQDMRNGGKPTPYYSNKQKSWAGTQRLRTMERNSADDEQFASNYVQFKEERQDKSANETKEVSSPKVTRNRLQNVSEQPDYKEMTQRERLSEQLDKGTLECLVCCERVKQMETVWSCSNCYHVLHLRCIRKWAMSSMQEGKWRCPACQNTNSDVPTEYRCLCGAMRSPEWQRGAAGAHTCGRPCARPRSCPHPCTLLCHPGPCPPCHATVNKKCGCGAETRSVLCSSKLPQVCGRVCGHKLNCDVHSCTNICHEGPCEECTEMLKQECYCPAAKTREVVCDASTAGQPRWACGDVCGRVLACGSHVCRDCCHPPPCQPCKLLPDTVDTCPCGKMRLEKDKRKSCVDPIPLCGNICAKPLPCGPSGDRHFCKQECHEGKCSVCPDKTLLPCRCGHSSREVACADLPQMLDNVFCQKKCNKKLSCGRHRCRELCCALEAHRCRQVCGRALSCQLHRCEEFCHTGHCPICPRVSFNELRCECGAEVVLPPVRCGARPPACTAPCPRPRVCGHPPHHSCHSGDCPPCVVLTTKRCHGGHEERKTIPCSQEEFSCGLPCGKPLPCGKHTCIKICHKGSCDTEKCIQPCMEKRPSCGHPCGAPCHSGAEDTACPSTVPCRRPVRATCSCGRRSQERSCADNAREYSKILSNLVMSKMQEGGSVEVVDVSRPGAQLKTLDCDDECRVEARTRQMALALQIRNPDVSSKLAPRYSDHVRQWAARDPAFSQHVHDKLTELVQLAKKSKQKTRSHSFPSMNWQKRQFIHEMCEHFGCESVAYDAEPNRNVVATADKEKSWLPAMSVMEVLAREAGKRRVPGPVMRAPLAPITASASATSTNNTRDTKSAGSGWATLTGSSTWAARAAARPAAAPAPQPPAHQHAPVIDYFDNPPEC